MATHDDREGTSSSQQKTPRKRNPKTPRTVRPPVIEPGGIYAGQDLIANFRIDPAELRRLNRLPTGGLYPLDTGTREEFYSSDEVIAFFKARPRLKKGPPARATKPTAKRK